MYFITTKRMLEVCFSVHPNIQYRTYKKCSQYVLAAVLSLFEGKILTSSYMARIPVQ